MSARDHFLQAILDRPDDDGPRLIFADWLEEYGDLDRAEFIRVQCELARMPWSDPRHAALWEQQQELWYAHAAAWGADLPQFQGIRWEWFERGFAERITALDFTALLKHAADLFRAAPVRSLHLVLPSVTDVMRLADTRWLTRIVRLDVHRLGDGDGSGAVRRVFFSPFATGLRQLKVDNSSLTDLTLQGLADSPVLRRLTTLEFGGNSIGPKSAEALAAVGALPELRDLSLGVNPLSQGGAVLAAAPALAAVTWLDLVGCQLGNAGAVALANSPYVGRLETLRLQSNQITDAAAVALAESPHLAAITDLQIQGNHLTREGERRLHERFGTRVTTAYQNHPDGRVRME